MKRIIFFPYADQLVERHEKTTTDFIQTLLCATVAANQANRVFRFSGIFSNSAIALRIRARGKQYLSDIVLEYIIFAC